MNGGAFTVWFTGLSGSGKSTLARLLSAHLDRLAIRHQILDGDELRRTISRDLGYSKEDRNENRSVGRFVEVFLDCSRDVLVKRDPKGLYLY